MLTFGIWFGIITVIAGVLGFIPGITTNGRLLWLFQVDTLHNVIHIVTGLLTIWAANASITTSRSVWRILGVVYALVTILGFFTGSAYGLVETNTADNILHLLIAAIGLYLGFAPAQK